MSLISRKSTSRPSVAAAAQRARDAATQVVPKAKDAVPMAKNAGLTARQSAEDAVAWATPKVKDARAWAAPHVEQAGLAVRDKIAPAISDALVEAAHRLDDTAQRRRRWPRIVAGITMLAAACSAVAAAIVRRRPTDTDFGTGVNGATAPETTEDMAADTSPPSPEASGEADGQAR